MPVDEPVDEEEDFLVSDTEEGSAAITNAQLALSKTVDVDVDGGWKVGERCVLVFLSPYRHSIYIPLVFHMRPLLMYLA